jgi:hypothetical protein
MASATVANGAAFSIDAGTFNLPSGLSFTNTAGLVAGQELKLHVVAGSLSSPTNNGFGPPSVSFTTDALSLEVSQISSQITAIGSDGASFTLVGPPTCMGFPASCNTNSTTQITVETTSQTTYQGLSPDSFAGLTVNSYVSIGGWFFATPGGATPSTAVAQTVAAQSEGPPDL